MLVRRLVSALLSPVLAAGIRGDYAQASDGRNSEIISGNAIGGRSECWCDQTASNRERMEAATWLADKGFGKPAPVREDNPSGIGDFTIVIGDHQDDGNPIIEA
ncbi:MAG: hypothetical protein QF357_12780, partial [Dehalococcoidia bacterium]|nr:hypothetical protein [Dehalococcoidia bacterium]